MSEQGSNESLPDPPTEDAREKMLDLARSVPVDRRYRVYFDDGGEIIESIAVSTRGRSAIQSEPDARYLIVLQHDPDMTPGRLDREIERQRPGGDPTPPAMFEAAPEVPDGFEAEAETEADEEGGDGQ